MVLLQPLTTLPVLRDTQSDRLTDKLRDRLADRLRDRPKDIEDS